MTIFLGMDTDQALSLVEAAASAAETLADMADACEAEVARIVEDAWRGPDADAFRDAWASAASPSWRTAIDGLRERVALMRDEIAEQDDTSAADPGAAAGAGPAVGEPGAVPRAFFADILGRLNLEGEPADQGIPPHLDAQNFLGLDFEGWNLGRVRDEFLKDIGIDPIDASGAMVGAPHSFAEQVAKQAGGKVPFFIPVVGDVYAGAVAGVQRWNEDSDRTDLTTGDRVGRAVLDGAANGFGSLLGGMVLGPAGSAIGGVIGGAAGGTGGSSGGPAGAGAGGIGGAGLGVIIGGVVGDGFGSYAGGTGADAFVDSILDSGQD